MQTRNFHAITQANELEGTAVADRADFNTAWQWLQTNGQIQMGELLIGIELSASHDEVLRTGDVNVTFLLTCCESIDAVKQCLFQGAPVFVRQVHTQISATEFLRLFKHFSVTLSPKAILQAQDYVFLSHEYSTHRSEA